MTNINKHEFCVCLGYESLVIPFSLYSKRDNITIISDRSDIIKLCKYLNISFVEFPKINIKEMALHSKRIKSFINNKLQVQDYKSFNIHLTHKNFGLHSIVAMVFCKYGNVYFHKTELDTEAYYKTIFYNKRCFLIDFKQGILFWLIYKPLIQLMWGLSITYKEVLGQMIPVMKERSLKKNGIQIVEYKELNKFFIDSYSEVSLNIPQCKNLYIYDDVDEMSSMIERKSLLDLSKLIGQQDVVYKFHPNRNYDIQNDVKCYETFIPAELIINNVKNSVVGLVSASLRYSAKKRSIKTISCIELVKWIEEKDKLFFIEYLKNWSENILYPKTIEELINYLEDT